MAESIKVVVRFRGAEDVRSPNMFNKNCRTLPPSKVNGSSVTTSRLSQSQKASRSIQALIATSLSIVSWTLTQHRMKCIESVPRILYVST